MVFFWGAATVGSLSGLGISLFTNMTRKIPLSRMPWNHVGSVIVGFYVGDQYVKLENRLRDEVNEMRMDRGLPPFVGVAGWFPERSPVPLGQDSSEDKASKSQRQPAAAAAH